MSAEPTTTAQTGGLVERERAPWGPGVCDPSSLAAFALYLGLSALFFGRALIGQSSRTHIGVGPDPGLMMWFLVWWPHAIAGGINPFVTRAAWAPAGFNLAWQTGIPLASFVASPLTLAAGPVAAFNTLSLLSLPLDAWSGFVLCRYLSRSWSGALVGGYVFGFSAFALAALRFGHLHLALVFCVPAIAYVAARRLAGEIRERAFILSLAILLVAQFLLSTEIFATMTMFAGFALLVGWWVSPPDAAQRVIGLLKPVACAYILSLIVVSPYLYYFLAYYRKGAIFPGSKFSIDLLNFLVPTRLNELGRVALLAPLANRFAGGWLAESDAYLGLPLFVIVIAYALRARDAVARTLTYSLIIVCVLALGPVLHVAGLKLPAGLPWLFLGRLPVLDNALPSRFALYAFLIAAVIASCWIAAGRAAKIIRTGLAVAVVVFNLPNLSARSWAAPVSIPAFFGNGIYARYLRRGETIVTLPYGYTGDCMLWQAETRMYFNMAEGYGAGRPEEFQIWPIVDGLLHRWLVPDPARQFRSFLSAQGVSTIVVTDPAFATWRSLLSTLGVAPVKVADVRLYRMPTGPEGAAGAAASMLEMSDRFNRQRFGVLAEAAQEYLAAGGDLGSLSVLQAEKSGLLPASDLIGLPPPIHLGAAAIPNAITDPRNAYGVYLGRGRDGYVAIGVFAWNPLELVGRLRDVAEEIYFPHPARLGSRATVEPIQGWLVAELTPSQLKRAATAFAPLVTQESGARPETPPIH